MYQSNLPAVGLNRYVLAALHAHSAGVHMCLQLLSQPDMTAGLPASYTLNDQPANRPIPAPQCHSILLSEHTTVQRAAAPEAQPS